MFDGRSHGLIQSTYNLFGGKLGNVDRRYVDQLNELSRLRVSARYGGTINLSDAEMERFLRTAHDMLAELESLVPKRAAVPNWQEDSP